MSSNVFAARKWFLTAPYYQRKQRESHVAARFFFFFAQKTRQLGSWRVDFIHGRLLN
jgi:hypothetical protein